MAITLDEIVALQHNSLNTLSRKVMFMMIRNNQDHTGWATISGGDFANSTSLSRRNVNNVIQHLIAVGLVERRHSTDVPNSTFQYRIVQA